MIICEALQISTEMLLSGKINDDPPNYDYLISTDNEELHFIREYQKLTDKKKKRLLAYMNMLQNTKE